mgnify:CR=1 FL=1
MTGADNPDGPYVPSPTFKKWLKLQYKVSCDKPLDEICNLGYACDSCPYNKFKLKPKGFVFR